MSNLPSTPSGLVHGRISAAGAVLGPLLLGGESEARLYPALWEWCVANDHVPEAIVGLITDLSALDADSPVLARLQVLVKPTAEGFQALAHWESRWHVLEPDWTEAFLRWARGEPRTEADGVILGELLERSPFTRTVQLAVKRHRRAARKALRLAYRCTLYRPIDRVILETWSGAFASTIQ